MRPHVVVAVDLDQPDLAELALLDDAVAGLDEVRRAAPLRADLHDALVLAGGGHHRLAFDNVDADRLLHPDIGAGLDGRDHRQRVPVVRRADQHDVEISFLQHLAIIGIGRGFLCDACRCATISAASASIWLSTSHSDTTSTGAT